MWAIQLSNKEQSIFVCLHSHMYDCAFAYKDLQEIYLKIKFSTSQYFKGWVDN